MKELFEQEAERRFAKVPSEEEQCIKLDAFLAGCNHGFQLTRELAEKIWEAGGKWRTEYNRYLGDIDLIQSPDKKTFLDNLFNQKEG